MTMTSARRGVTLAMASVVMAVAATALAVSPGVAGAPAVAPDWHATVRDFTAKHFKNPAWGYSHSIRDYALARELAAPQRYPTSALINAYQ